MQDCAASMQLYGGMIYRVAFYGTVEQRTSGKVIQISSAEQILGLTQWPY
jgi:hypothetical protein